MSVDLLERYRDYVDAFNAHDLRALEDYLHPDVVFEWDGVMPDLVGRRAFLDFYRLAWDHFDEVIRPRVIEVGDDALRAWIDTTLRIVRDWPDCPIQPYAAGEIHHVAGEVTYRFQDHRIAHIA